MIPLGDDNTMRKSVPVVTYALIALNILFFLFELSMGEEFLQKWAFVPSRFLANPIAEIPTIFTSMFMHAGIAHIAGNMLYLWIFGDNVEDYLGKIQFLIFYLLCGMAATFSQMAAIPDSSVPNVGASGAIAGVLGAYIVLFPGEKIRVMMGNALTQMSALLVIGFWFVLQFIGNFSSTEEEGGGVAYMAHIGGFILGLIIAFFFKQTRKV